MNTLVILYVEIHYYSIYNYCIRGVASNALNTPGNPQKCTRAYLSTLLFLKLTIPLSKPASLITTHFFALFMHWHYTQQLPNAISSIRIHAHKETSSRVTKKWQTTRNVFFAPRFRTDWRGATLHGRSTPTNLPSRRSPPPVSNCSVPATEGQLTFFCCHSRLISYDDRSRLDTTTRWVVEGHVYLLLLTTLCVGCVRYKTRKSHWNGRMRLSLGYWILEHSKV